MNELSRIEANDLGMQTALIAAVRALIASHPQPDALARAMELEHQDSLMLLTNAPVPEQVLDAFHLTWNLVVAPGANG